MADFEIFDRILRFSVCKRVFCSIGMSGQH